MATAVYRTTFSFIQHNRDGITNFMVYQMHVTLIFYHFGDAYGNKIYI